MMSARRQDRFPYGEYEFPYIVRTTRALQFGCCLLQILIIYSESGSIGMIPFVYYNTVCAMYTMHVFRRWCLNIDGRFDLRQLLREPENTTKIQYAIALFTPSFLSILIFLSVYIYTPALHIIWTATCILEIILAVGLISLECYEVFILEN
ncbi:unnamed protein product [Cylicocyclus nassatus]|uniref:DUF7087 domain-containing protein n=1 Tax=Cylicocyclus nassatus TaxID=53992 RepID=A0AA36GN80_CYLNA|nr:unnamed protein product [Cylicocyclus nassatus]